jgi:hypothetical protein
VCRDELKKMTRSFSLSMDPGRRGSMGSGGQVVGCHDNLHEMNGFLGIYNPSHTPPELGGEGDRGGGKGGGGYGCAGGGRGRKAFSCVSQQRHSCSIETPLILRNGGAGNNNDSHQQQQHHRILTNVTDLSESEGSNRSLSVTSAHSVHSVLNYQHNDSFLAPPTPHPRTNGHVRSNGHLCTDSGGTKSQGSSPKQVRLCVPESDLQLPLPSAII